MLKIDLQYWEKRLLNLKGGLDEALEFIDLNNNLGDVEKAETKLNKFDELMKSVDSNRRVGANSNFLALENYNEWLQNGNTSNSDTLESKFIESLESKAEGVNFLVSSIKSLEFSLKKQLGVVEANRSHSPLKWVSNVSPEFKTGSLLLKMG